MVSFICNPSPSPSDRALAQGSVSPCARVSARCAAFTLIELLVVIGIMVVLMTLLVPAFNALRGNGDITSAAYDIAGVLDNAKAYAKANNTYVWVGFYEEDSTALTATAAQPPYPGKGRVIMATVASKDGTTIIDDSASGSLTLTAASLNQVGKLVTIQGIHLTDIGAPAGGNPDSLDGRSNLPYDTAVQGPITTQNRISSDNTEKTSRPFVAQNYTFWKTIRFSPRGEANLNSTYKTRRVAEIGLKPTHGTSVDTATPNVVALQITGILGGVKIYRR